MTVSRVVNGNGYVSAETREKVLSAVSALNYRRNGLARGLKRQRTDTIGLVLGDIANPFAAELARAVREVMSAKGYNVFICVSEHGLKVDERLIVGRADNGDQWPGYSTETMGYEGMKKLLALRKRPTAVFARNDFTAVGAMSAAKEAGLKIPQDIAVVGYDDMALAAHTTPPLTTVRQPTREQGRIAAEALVRRMESAETPAREERVIPCALVVRASTVGD